MEILRTIEELRAWRRLHWSDTIGFVPTMGFLHEGHLTLMRKASELSDHVVVSVYVNPTQFGPNEDLDSYPRDMEGDIAKCESVGVSAIFLPSNAMMYGDDFATTVEVDGGMGDNLCGASREGHFNGVTLIVSKLFNLVQPDVAVFGQKDYQQLAIIRRMVKELNFPIDVVGVPTVRERDGLAKSSRNRYLEGEHRTNATVLYRALKASNEAWAAGERDAGALLGVAQGVLDSVDGIAVDYLSLVDPEKLNLLEGTVEEARGCVMALAVHVGKARLIDNMRLDGPLPELSV